MKLHNIWGYGQLFGYSAIDGPNRYYNDFIGTLTRDKIGVRFELENWVKVKFPVRGEIQFTAITGDMIDATVNGAPFFMTFLDNDTLVGYSPVLPRLIGEKKLVYKKSWNVDVWISGKDAFGVMIKETVKGYQFCIHHSFSFAEARSGANRYIEADVDALKKQRYAYYENMPACRDEKYTGMYYKALSVNKVNVRSAEGQIPCTWTTPDRVPHRHMWLWDSVFHALAMVNYNPEIAKSAIDAVLSQMREDGFMPHMMNPTDSSDVTQPQVLAWGVWELYKKTGDKEYLKKHADKLEKYLAWDNANRDNNGNGLLEWLTEPGEILCKCGESGQDDSPRFDGDEELDAIDFSVFASQDARYLSKIFREIGDFVRAEKWEKISKDFAEKINEILWCEEDGVYYDRGVEGTFSKILTPTSFFPMMAGIASKEQAEKLVEKLTDRKLLWRPAPVPTVAKNHPTYAPSMWRGGVWLNLNYFVVIALKKYGYEELAETLRFKTLEMVKKWYEKTGTIFEFYDPENKIVPYLCQRKEKCAYPPDWRKQVHSIVDFNWSSCFTLMLIQREWYGLDE